jgi:hypothetical protein
MSLKTPAQIRDDRAADTARQARRSELENEDFVRLMRAEWGRRIVARLLKAGRHRSPNFETNGMVMSRQVGVSDFVQTELADRIFDLCPENYATLRRENP